MFSELYGKDISIKNFNLLNSIALLNKVKARLNEKKFGKKQNH